jgi:predicted dehydrogenase
MSERAGKLYIQNYAMGAAFIGEGERKPGGWFYEMDVWIKAVRGEGELVVKPEQAYVVTRILEAIYRSAATGDVIHMDQF